MLCCLPTRLGPNAGSLARAAVEAAERQHTAVTGEEVIAQMVHTLATEVTALNEKIAEIDKLIEGRFRQHELAEIVSSLPGIGPLLGAEFRWYEQEGRYEPIVQTNLARLGVLS